MPGNHRIALFALPALVAAGCAEDPARIFSDLPLVVDGEQPAIPDDVPPALVAGHEDDEGEFVELSEGSVIPIIHGPQGGRWLHLAMRATAMRREGQVEVTLRRDGPDGAVVAAAGHRILLSPTSEGYIEARDVPVSVPLTDEEIAALDGLPAHLHLGYAAADRQAAIDLVLVFGDEDE